jgi:hypothetical protein
LLPLTVASAVEADLVAHLKDHLLGALAQDGDHRVVGLVALERARHVPPRECQFAAAALGITGGDEDELTAQEAPVRQLVAAEKVPSPGRPRGHVARLAQRARRPLPSGGVTGILA